MAYTETIQRRYGLKVEAVSSNLPAVITGATKPYKGNGRKLGYPTANIASETDLADGVYFGYADLESHTKAPAIIFIGTPTTVGDTERRVEAHLLDIVDKNYYDLPITLQVKLFYRSNKHFSSIEALRVAMKQDEQAARTWFLEQ